MIAIINESEIFLNIIDSNQNIQSSRFLCGHFSRILIYSNVEITKRIRLKFY